VKLVRCEDGVVIAGDTDEDLIANVRRHIAERHPGLIGKLSDDEILAMARDVA
jgi:hypothetical protein